MSKEIISRINIQIVIIASSIVSFYLGLKIFDRELSLIERLSDTEMIGFYAHCLGLFVGSYEEDYGYVTLEVILAVKPVITCNDSGEAVEFVIDQETAFVINPQNQRRSHKPLMIYTFINKVLLQWGWQD
ncbi:glycosyltransferase [Nostoc sp. 'Peltigera malacea cyanobiont' DB3992]|uniref:glycosyltransferase n=1 Tax=Nostoc sp. 'Peltigera malacea cyanobiont' DB3992 TaxID=1206980 RepID=UPI000C05472A|nr:glycosyltransferase [Nostoc sp. 'Peltigera malacea cyanobiont' DB3992]PHM09239.1 hypothetical protein CK516_15770 [Nostoc sp. 'Peltigera malacea cyanobiont' DB3992]